jgi:hypothetical protein
VRISLISAFAIARLTIIAAFLFRGDCHIRHSLRLFMIGLSKMSGCGICRRSAMWLVAF